MRLPAQPHRSQAADQNKGYLTLAVGIVLLAFAIRVIALFSLPVFIDEELHASRAYQVAQGDLFVGVANQKWLYTVALGLFRPTGPELLWLGRAISGLCGTATTAVTIALSGLVGWRVVGGLAAGRAGLAAGLIYALLPMAVFHERQALVDPMMTTFAAASTLLVVHLAQRPRPVVAIPLGLTLGGAVLTKTSALPYLLLPLAGIVLIARRGRLQRGLALGAGAGVTGGAMYWGVQTLAAASGIRRAETHEPALNNTVLGGLPGPDALLIVRENLAAIAQGGGRYVGWAVLGLALLALIWLAWRRAGREIAFLAIPAFVFLLPYVIFKPVTGRGHVAPRYLLNNTVALVTLAALALALLVKRVHPAHPRAAGWAGAMIMAAVLLPALRSDAALISDPPRTPLVPDDRQAYFEAYDGPGTRALAEALLEAWQAGGGERIGVMGVERGIAVVDLFLGPRVGEFADLTSDSLDGRALLAKWLNDGLPVFVFDYKDGDHIDDLNGIALKHIGTYGVWRLYRVIDPKAHEQAAGEGYG